jgi:hypothetical protein
MGEPVVFAKLPGMHGTQKAWPFLLLEYPIGQKRQSCSVVAAKIELYRPLPHEIQDALSTSVALDQYPAWHGLQRGDIATWSAEPPLNFSSTFPAAHVWHWKPLAIPDIQLHIIFCVVWLRRQTPFPEHEFGSWQLLAVITPSVLPLE